MNNKMPSNFAYPPGFVLPETVEEDAANHLQKLTFPGGFACYAPPNCDEVALIYNEIMVNQEYFQKGLSVLGAGCVIDIGANVGIFTMAVKLQAPNATLYAFEPIPDTFQVLEQNVRLIGSSDIHLFNVALGSQDHAEKTLTFFPYMPGNSTAFPVLKDQEKPLMDQMFGKELSDFYYQTETRVVQVRTLSSVIRERGISRVDFLKIDVEGSEISVLEGIEEMHWPLFKQVAVETHTAQLHKQVSEMLVQHGFEASGDLGLSSFLGVSMLYAHAT
jgi:FkbM family methyltransferase